VLEQRDTQQTGEERKKLRHSRQRRGRGEEEERKRQIDRQVWTERDRQDR
jgi:hypothetical protein